MSGYKKFMELKMELEKEGHMVLHPDIEFEMKGDDTSVGAYFDRNGGIDAFPPEHDVWKKKGEAITKHFRKIDEGDAILVTNYEKKGIENYIGGNTFLEIGYAFGKGKKIFILNDLPEQSAYKEEILGMQPIVLNGDISKIR
jgi:nucleoside 2-deoxyribosyltransferase